jgi:RND family efflux transporter MFP subunit
MENIKRIYLWVSIPIMLSVVAIFFVACGDDNKTATSQMAASEHAGPQMGHEGHTMPAEKPKGEKKILYYVDPMHPAYKSDKPGTAPDCGMDLVPVYDEGEQAATSVEGLATVRISAEKQQLIGVRTDTVQYQEVERVIRAVGQVTYAEPKQAYVTTKFEGYIEDLFVDYTGKLVTKGQPLFSVYSPELVSTQEEYLLALRTQKQLSTSVVDNTSSGANTLLESAKRRLLLWDITEKEIQELERTGKPTKALTIHSPIRGYVIEKMTVRGMKVMPGMNLYQIADLSTVWVLADLYEFEIPFIKVGQEAKVTLTSYPGAIFKGRVTYVYPYLTPDTRTVKVRLELANPEEKLKPQMYANVDLKVNLGRQLVIPADAVLDSGVRQVAFVDLGDGRFEPRVLQLGAMADDRYIVLDGLKAGERIVTSANFLIDSESKLKAALTQMSGHGHQ